MSKILDINKFEIEGVSTDRPLVIAGPCSAESEEQVMATAKAVKEKGIQIFRSGIWKPRTRPGSFEGIGTLGLQWLKRVQDELGLVAGTEVANAQHVEEALEAGIGILWIGARTTANPFAVQDIADALKGVDVPVLVKNPVNPDLELWIGALERINLAGVKRLGAIHRGFSTYGKALYRNNPQWQIPIELRRRIPELPIVCDPSHICGTRDLIFEISQKAMDLNMEGLIIETHLDPDKAFSDAQQQITPDTLKEILDTLVLRHADIDNSVLMHTLEDLRGQIDKFDNQIIDIFHTRMNIAEQIGKYKKDNNITILQTNRWDELLSQRIEKATSKGLSQDFIIKIFRAIHQESINRQTKVMNEDK